MAAGTEVARLFASVSADLSGLNKGLSDASSKMEQAGQKMTSAGTKLSLGVTLPILGIGAASLDTAAKFERSGNKLQAISGATGEQMDALRGKALQLGKDTSFGAGDAMTGMLELSKAGLSVDQTMSAISGTLSLAAAAGIEVGQASEIASNAMNMFRLEGSEVGRVADILAATANASSVEITDLADSLNMAGAVAASAGMGIDAVSTAFGLLGNQGMKGSDAGTSLKQMLLSLEAPSDKAAKMMGEMGLAAYNADGSMKSLRDIIGNLGSATADMTQQERDFTLATLFGSDAVRAANILLSQGVEGYDKMSASVNAAGAAQKAADANTKGLSGALEYFSGTVDTLMIGSGTPWLDMLNGMVRGSADLLSSFGKLPEPVQKTGVVLGGVAAATGPLLVAVGTMASGVSALTGLFHSHTLALVGHKVGTIASTVATGAWTAAQWALNVALSANPIGLVVVGLAALTAGIIWAYKNVGWFHDGVDAAFGFIKSTVPKVLDAAGKAVEWFGNILADTWRGVQDVTSRTWDWISSTITGAIGAVESTIQSGASWISTTLSSAWDGIKGVASAAWDAFTSMLRGVWDGIVGLVDAKLTEMRLYLDAGWVLVESGARAAWDGLTGLTRGAWDGLSGIVRGGVNEVIGFVNQLISAWNGLEFSIPGFGVDFPSVDVPGVGVVGGGSLGWGGITIGTPDLAGIPYLANGGDILQSGMAIVGDRGPELLDLPQGARVTPLPFGLSGRGEATTVINNYFTLTGTMLADDRSTARQLAELLKPELDGLVRLSA